MLIIENNQAVTLLASLIAALSGSFAAVIAATKRWKERP